MAFSKSCLKSLTPYAGEKIFTEFFGGAFRRQKPQQSYRCGGLNSTLRKP